MSVRVRPETSNDAQAIRAVNLAAFPTAQEADLVDALRANGDVVISLVAEEKGALVGHVLLSRMQTRGDGRPYRALGLAPVAVMPARQRQGIGSALIEEALRRAEDGGADIVFLLGEPCFYQRFGFSADAAAPFTSPYAGQYFMAKPFAPLPQSGKADYAPAFGRLS